MDTQISPAAFAGRRHRLAASLLLLAAAGLAAAPLGAQEVYKSRLPDGRIVYSDKPPAGASKVETIDQSRVMVEKASAEENRRASKAAAKGDPRSSAAARADAQMQTAQDAVAKAKKQQAEGQEPLPGERTGIVSKTGTNTRLNDAYEARQKTLLDEVTTAQQRLDQATKQRSSIK